MGLLDDIADYLESSVSLFTTFKIDVLSEEDTALTLRRYPSNVSTKFMDKSRDDTIGFQVLVRHPDQSIAVEIIETIVGELTKARLKGTSYNFITCDIYTHPILIEISDHGCYLYSALMQAKINVS